MKLFGPFTIKGQTNQVSIPARITFLRESGLGSREDDGDDESSSTGPGDNSSSGGRSDDSDDESSD